MKWQLIILMVSIFGISYYLLSPSTQGGSSFEGIHIDTFEEDIIPDSLTPENYTSLEAGFPSSRTWKVVVYYVYGDSQDYDPTWKSRARASFSQANTLLKAGVSGSFSVTYKELKLSKRISQRPDDVYRTLWADVKNKGGNTFKTDYANNNIFYLIVAGNHDFRGCFAVNYKSPIICGYNKYDIKGDIFYLDNSLTPGTFYDCGVNKRCKYSKPGIKLLHEFFHSCKIGHNGKSGCLMVNLNVDSVSLPACPSILLGYPMSCSKQSYANLNYANL